MVSEPSSTHTHTGIILSDLSNALLRLSPDMLNQSDGTTVRLCSKPTHKVDKSPPPCTDREREAMGSSKEKKVAIPNHTWYYYYYYVV